MPTAQPAKASWWKRNWKWVVGVFLIVIDANATADGTSGGGLLPALAPLDE